MFYPRKQWVGVHIAPRDEGGKPGSVRIAALLSGIAMQSQAVSAAARDLSDPVVFNREPATRSTPWRPLECIRRQAAAVVVGGHEA